jgi:hypothetical protein
MNPQGTEALKALMISGIDDVVEIEANRLKFAVEMSRQNGGGLVTDTQPGQAATLEKLGLLRYAGKSSGIHSDEFCYVPTPEGLRVYELLFDQHP